MYDKHVSKEQYKYAEGVWKTPKCITMKDYHDHYLITDILLLADVFEHFRKMSLETYSLHPIHYYSLPSLSWDAMLKYTGVELHQMVEKSRRGVISNIYHRHATSNHPNMDTYNENEEPTTLTYQDANSLYSWTMSQMLPLEVFKWVYDEIDILNVPDDSKLGYILVVNLEHPKELRDKHNPYPLAPAHVQVTDDMLSPFQRKHFPTIRGSVRKFVPNLRTQKKCVVHYRKLQLYVSLGMKIKKIHRVMQFEQSCWMKPYIDLNNEKRKEATMRGDKAGKDLFKLFKNAVFGKIMENLRKRINFEVVT